MKLLLLDIETAPHRVYAWGLWSQGIAINQIEEPGYTMCWAAKWHGEREVMFDSIKQSKPAKMIRGIHALMDEADAVVHYNGTKFDVPTLNQEFVIHGLNPPAPYKQIDLLTTAKRQFRLASNKLDYVAGFLGVGSKLQHKGMDLWRDCMALDDAAWRVMERYNKQDVRLLEKVYDRLLPWIPNHPNVSLYEDGKGCTHCGSHNLQRRGLAYTTSCAYPRYQCKDCGKWVRGRALEKKQPEMVSV